MRPCQRLITLIAVATLEPTMAQAQQATAEADATGESGIVLSEQAVVRPSGEPQPPAYTAAWMVYAGTAQSIARSLWGDQVGNGTHNDYSVEAGARSAMAAYWRDLQRRNEAPADNYLARLVEIDDAGFIEEYVISTFAEPGWTIPPAAFATIELRAFWKWASEHIAGLESPTYAHFKSGVRVTAPGSDLPDPDRYSLGSVPCVKSLDALREAVALWHVEEKKLQGTAISAETGAEFNAILDRIMQMEPYRKTGVIWVSTRPAILTFAAGFCAVDIGNLALAQSYLEEAISLTPLAVGPKLELAHTLIAQGQLDKAEELVDAALAVAQDRCELGRIWRKRGYIRFDQGKLSEARDAYKKSLEFDPQSRTAIEEIELLEGEIVKHGGTPDPYKPPPPGEQIAVQCAP
jgi:tetratricopeptide (TPR) repeat protein